MQNETERELSPLGAQRLGNWLRKQGAFTPPLQEPPDTATLVRACAGLLPPQEAEIVVKALTASSANRERWLQIEQILCELQQLSLGEVQTVSTGDDLRAEVARSWLHTISAQTGLLARLPRWWERLQTALREEVEATAEAFTLLNAVWHRWTAMMRIPAFAQARSGDRAQVLLGEGMPRDVQVLVDRFSVTPGGTLSLSVMLRQPDGSPAKGLSGAPIAVAVNLGGEIIPLAAGEVFDSQYETSLPLPTTLEALPAGGLPQSHLVIVLGDVSPSFGGQRARVPLELEGESPAWSEIEGLPECVNGRLRMRVHLPDEVRQRYADHRLAVELSVAPAAWQRIGEWEISRWQTESTELIADAPGLPDGILPSTVLVRMQLRRTDECTT